MADGYNLVLRGNREIAHRIIDTAPFGSRFEVKPPRRTLEQNALMWTLLGEVAAAKPEGRSLTPDVWKALFLHALDHTQRFEMALDGKGMVPVGFRSSKLTKEQMSALIDTICEYGARHGVEFSQ